MQIYFSLSMKIFTSKYYPPITTALKIKMFLVTVN